MNHKNDNKSAQIEKETAQRVSKHLQPTDDMYRHEAILNVMRDLLLGQTTQGQALKTLRIHITGLKQVEYAALVKVSRKTISDIENDRGSFQGDILNKVFKPFGMKVGIIPINANVLQNIIKPQ